MMKLMHAALAATTLLCLSVGSAHAGKITEVNMVPDGIDITPVEVRANSNGYVAIRTKSRGYSVRVFAKGKGTNHIYWAAVASYKNVNPFTRTATYYHQKAPNGSDGWGVYKKNLLVRAATENTSWALDPVAACKDNLKKQVANGLKKSDVLRREWKVKAYANLYFNVAVDSKSRIKNRKTSKKTSEFGSRGIHYPVIVLCEEAL